MRQVSDSWADAVALSHDLSVYVALLDGDDEVELETVTDGSVTADSSAATRSRLDLTVIDDGTLGLVPESPASPLVPFGNEIRAERGLIYENGDVERVSLGIFGIDDVEPSDTGDALSIRIAASDRSRRVIDAKFEEAYQVAAGVNYGDAILSVVQDAYPDVESDFAATSLLTPALIAGEGEDRWAFAQGMATAIGAELYFDGDGILVLRPVPSAASGNPAFELSEGERGVLIEASPKWARERVFNRVIVTGENTGAGTPARGVATDDNPLSPTYYYAGTGGFGKKPYFWSSEYITTDDQAADVAAAILAKTLGIEQPVSFGAVVNPALEPGDVVRITRERLHVDADFVIDSLTIPLTAQGTMSGQTRATQVS